MPVIVLPFAGFQRQRWKNGGGTTFEVAVEPPHAGFDTFDWRLSFAAVDRSGPFSLLPGVDRILTMVDGAVSLSGLAAAPIRLDPTSAPLAFAGERAVFGAPIGGPALDLNAMARRGRATMAVRRVVPGDVVQPRTASFFCALAPITLAGNVLDRLDCMLLSTDVTAPGEALVVDFDICG